MFTPKIGIMKIGIKMSFKKKDKDGWIINDNIHLGE